MPHPAAVPNLPWFVVPTLLLLLRRRWYRAVLGVSQKAKEPLELIQAGRRVARGIQVSGRGRPRQDPAPFGRHFVQHAGQTQRIRVVSSQLVALVHNESEPAQLQQRRDGSGVSCCCCCCWHCERSDEGVCDCHGSLLFGCY